MEAIISALVEEEKKRFPGGVPWKFSYGTAGFREKYVVRSCLHNNHDCEHELLGTVQLVITMNELCKSMQIIICTKDIIECLLYNFHRADKLDRVVFRVGVLAALRSKSVGGQYKLS